MTGSYDGRPHLLGLLPEDLGAILAARGTEADPGEARRLVAHVISEGRGDLDVPGGVSRSLRRAVDEELHRHDLELVERAADGVDGFVKYLFRSPDGALSEAVLIPLRGPERFTVCLSSQVGCAMGCAFCATGRLGLERDLEAWEMVAAFRQVRRDVTGRLTGAVFMGQGEPLANLDEVLQAARVLSHPCGGRVAGRAISISTVGLPGAVRRYTAEGHPYRLVISLTSAVPARRRELLPVAGAVPLAELAAAIRAHGAATGQRVTIAWVVLSGVNTGQDEVDALARLVGETPCRLNLIDVNDPRPDGYRRAGEAELARFIDALQALKAPVVRRYSGMAASWAACGMLRSARVGS